MDIYMRSVNRFTDWLKFDREDTQNIGGQF
jgi:hypothetical protein